MEQQNKKMSRKQKKIYQKLYSHFYYLTRGGKPKPVPFLMFTDINSSRHRKAVLKWGKVFNSPGRKIVQTTVGEAWVSTVFLALNHDDFRRGKPVLFETMVFGGPRDEEQYRYTTMKAARNHHKQLVEQLKKEQNCPNIVHVDFFDRKRK